MTYFIFNSDWLTEHCLICGSPNHIFWDNPEAHAWECWACFNKYWIDDLSKDTIIIENNVDDDEADDMLTNCHPSIIFLHGHSERKQNG